jgi:branched-chain amino acid aminotransferase
MLEWCAADGMPAREAAPGELRFEVLDDVLAGRAALAITSSTRNVQPVATLDGTDVGLGELCLQAQKLFEARLADDVDP